MASATRSTYSVTELGPDGGPIRSYNAVITPYYAGDAPPGYRPGAGTPTHPIALPGDPWWGQDLKPTHPIVLPPDQPPPTGEPDAGGWLKPPPSDGGWGYHQDHGWLYKPAPGAPGPK